MKTKYWKKIDIIFSGSLFKRQSACRMWKSEKCGQYADREQRKNHLYLVIPLLTRKNEEADVNPHNTYAGWACIRYGIGETLFHYSDAMEIEPWLATEYENPDDLTWIITLRDDVSFSSGRKMDGEAVKECLEHLIEVHERARGDLMIDSITAEGQTVTIKTQVPKPTLLNYLPTRMDVSLICRRALQRMAS